MISRTGDSAKEIALDLERHGLRFVAAMNGGMMAWHDLGFATSRDPAIAGRLDQLRAVADAPPPAPGPLSLGEVEAHVGDPFSIRWLKLAALLVHGRLSCVDGRDDSGVIGTPGGDGGEFLMALVAVEHATGRHLDLPTIGALIERRLDAFGRFYMHTDLASANRFIASMRSDPRLDATLAHVFETIEWRKFMAGPPPEVREVVLEHLIQPAHFGCGHVRMMLTRSDEYGVRPELVKMFMRSFMMARWAGSPHLELVPLAGGHAEGAVLNVRTERPLFPFSHVPLVSPLAAGSQMFINHPQVASFLRDQLAAFLAQQSDLLGLSDADIPALRRCMEDLAGRQLGLTLGALAAGLPVYELLFRGERVSVKQEGSIPA